MNSIEVKEFTLAGLSLKTKTTNANGQSNIDCGNLWQQFAAGDYAGKIAGKVSDEMLAVYYAYEGDYTKPFSFFIGCQVDPGAVPRGMDSLYVPKGTYQKFTAKGKMPDCVVASWKEIWNSDIPRAYGFDFEVYDERSTDWDNAEVDIFISIKG